MQTDGRKKIDFCGKKCVFENYAKRQKSAKQNGDHFSRNSHHQAGFHDCACNEKSFVDRLVGTYSSRMLGEADWPLANPLPSGTRRKIPTCV